MSSKPKSSPQNVGTTICISEQLDAYEGIKLPNQWMHIQSLRLAYDAGKFAERMMIRGNPYYGLHAAAFDAGREDAIRAIGGTENGDGSANGKMHAATTGPASGGPGSKGVTGRTGGETDRRKS